MIPDLRKHTHHSLLDVFQNPRCRLMPVQQDHIAEHQFFLIPFVIIQGQKYHALIAAHQRMQNKRLTFPKNHNTGILSSNPFVMLTDHSDVLWLCCPVNNQIIRTAVQGRCCRPDGAVKPLGDPI